MTRTWDPARWVWQRADRHAWGRGGWLWIMLLWTQSSLYNIFPLWCFCNGIRMCVIKPAHFYELTLQFLASLRKEMVTEAPGGWGEQRRTEIETVLDSLQMKKWQNWSMWESRTVWELLIHQRRKISEHLVFQKKGPECRRKNKSRSTKSLGSIWSGKT